MEKRREGGEKKDVAAGTRGIARLMYREAVRAAGFFSLLRMSLIMFRVLRALGGCDGTVFEG